MIYFISSFFIFIDMKNILQHILYCNVINRSIKLVLGRVTIEDGTRRTICPKILSSTYMIRDVQTEFWFLKHKEYRPIYILNIDRHLLHTTDHILNNPYNGKSVIQYALRSNDVYIVTPILRREEDYNFIVSMQYLHKNRHDMKMSAIRNEDKYLEITKLCVDYRTRFKEYFKDDIQYGKFLIYCINRGYKLKDFNIEPRELL